MHLFAVEHIRKMRGGTQSHLMRASDGNLYVVKFKNNPQHTRVLANEFLATRLAEHLKLPVPATKVIYVKAEFVRGGEGLRFRYGDKSLRCDDGRQFGANYVVEPLCGRVFDVVPATLCDDIQNLKAFAGILVLDKWTCNVDFRQAVFWKKSRQEKYTATFIDQGHCFNAEQWNFPDWVGQGSYPRNWVYDHVRGWDSFEPWLTAVEQMPFEVIEGAAEAIPPEWYDGSDDIWRLIEVLFERRSKVRALISAFASSSRCPFLNWIEHR